MKAFSLGTMLVLCGALAACSSSGDDGTGTGSGSGGSGSGSGGGDAGSGGDTSSPTSTPTSTGASPTTTGQTTTTTTTGGGTCSVDPQIPDAICNTCVQDQCCTELEACFNGTVPCFDENDQLDPDSEGGAAYLACAENGCAEECSSEGGGVCESGISFANEDQTPNEELNACLTEACCDEFTACTADGTDVQSCIDCLQSEGGGALCDDAIACAEANCFSDICDTGIGFGDQAIDDCLSDACCTEYTTCIGDGSDAAVQDCLDCLNSEAGGALCDDAITCTNESGCVPEQ